MSMQDEWNKRFGKEDYFYGIEPNAFVKEQLLKLKPGKILFLAEGEGRNSVYAAKLGWDVDAVDFSISGKEKAERLAFENNVGINYQISDLNEFGFKENYYDVIVNNFFHTFEDSRISIHNKVKSSLKSGGKYILEAFAKDQIKRNTGGPKNLDLLYSLEEINNDFQDFDFIHFSKEETKLHEGSGHEGFAIVIRFIGEKV